MAVAVKQSEALVIQVSHERAISARMQGVIANQDARFLTLQEILRELRGPLHSGNGSRFLGRRLGIHDHSLSQGLRPGPAEIEYDNGLGVAVISNRSEHTWNKIPPRRRAYIDESAMRTRPLMVTVDAGPVFITISSAHGQYVNLAYIGPEELELKDVVSSLMRV